MSKICKEHPPYCFCKNIIHKNCGGLFPLLLFSLGLMWRTTFNQLQKLQNRAARILLDTSYNTPSGPLIKSLGWKTTRELADEESKLIVYKSINGLVPQYLRNLFTRTSFDNAYSVRNTTTDFMIPKKM